MNKTNMNPTNIKSARDHRPLRWIVKQWVNEVDEETGETYRHEISTGYHNRLEGISGMSSIYSQAMSNIRRFGGELYACYGDKSGPILVRAK